ncbi:MAG: tRNA (N(6)-L-threonylcarbamoyladenosine(37)-C(2))-methylthiotransferase MtaB [Alphaproteobacteria bacterium]|uniref:tRNA (N(6)-L-threonylcarbamoyladenosine(37)-C(2))-methylthiotransferase MtaB n=1 Tax=Candidatus Nitrobium versatile TaxID=2884831 RepID=A0A953M2A3_9BACT|nr:tRNA (N(6)-L-threonylcarbamoyladenosine(37)-C(2))-methylthiotransferase MtaB [Candidatus Nitrobium versatile]
MKISVLTLGCKTNQAESFHLERLLNGSGHEIVDLSGKPDLCVINTCTVTAKADYQSRQLIQRALKNNAKVIVTGCYAELNRERLHDLGSAVRVVRNDDKEKIFNLIQKQGSSDSGNLSHYPRHRPIVKVQDGCNYSCSYCAIPQARGRSRSIPVGKIVEEISFYASLGFNEVVLTGIHLGTYGADLSPRGSLSFLVKEILRGTAIRRVRLSSLEIREIDDELLEMLQEERLCHHLHIPLQSGSGKILKLMNRMYSSEEFSRGIERIAKRLPTIALGTDVIVGFPGEGTEEFEATHKLIESLPFTYLHVFPYSLRPGTRAASFPLQVDEAVKKERVVVLRDLGAEKRAAYLKRNIGEKLWTVIEKVEEEGATGTTGNYIKVSLRGSCSWREGMLVLTHITGIDGDRAVGVPENNPELFHL